MATRQASGPTRRRPRISDAESERLMLAAGLELVADHGLTVSLEHLSLEEIIRRAGVSRSAAYRRWPYRDDYFADLLLAIASTPMVFPESEATLADLVGVVGQHRATFRTPEGRRGAVVDGLRVSLQASLEELCASRQWRTYLALNAAYSGLPDGDLRARVAAALAQRETDYIAHRAAVYGALLDIIGYRVLPPLERAEGLELLASSSGALMTGFVVQATARPETIVPTRLVAALGGPERLWSEPALAMTAHFLGLIEPDPAVVWDDERIKAVFGMLRDRVAAARALRSDAGG